MKATLIRRIACRWICAGPPFEFGTNGLSWVAPKTFRSGARIKAQYGKDMGEEEDIEVTDFWDCEKNEVWLGEEVAPGWPKKA